MTVQRPCKECKHFTNTLSEWWPVANKMPEYGISCTPQRGDNKGFDPIDGDYYLKLKCHIQNKEGDCSFFEEKVEEPKLSRWRRFVNWMTRRCQ